MDLLDQLRTLDCIARAGSLSAAGRELDVAIAGVSKRLSGLEARVGVRLFQRSTRGLSLTEEGSAVLERARVILEDTRAFETMFSEQTKNVSGVLRVAAPCRFGERYVVPAVDRFLRQNPQADVVFSLTDRQQDLIAERLDIAVRIGKTPDSSYVRRLLAHSRRVICAAPSYLQRMGTPNRPEDLDRHQCLVLQFQDVWRFRHGERTLPIRVSSRVRCENGDVIADLCRRGLGIAMKSIWDVYEDLAEGRLVQLLKNYTLDDDGMIFILLPSKRFVPARVRAFISCLQEEIGAMTTRCSALPGT